MPPPSKKRKTAPLAEINFDFAAREEYLTGFHKRKQARIKHAQEEAAKKEKEEKVRFRRELREKRKEDLENHVKEVNMLVKQANGDLSEDVDGDMEEEGEEDAWEGFEQEPQVEQIEREEEYIDEDKYTTVTVETVNISKKGFSKTGENGEQEEDRGKEDGPGVKKRVWTKEKPRTNKPKKRKNKFRYESKGERKVTRLKERSKGRAQAQARKG